MGRYKQTLLILAALTLGSTSFAASANAKSTGYRNNERKVYIFHPEARNNQYLEKRVYYGSPGNYYRGPLRTNYKRPNFKYYREPQRTIYNGSRVDYYREPRTTIIIRGANRTYIKPNRW